jgi:cytochrome c-type biogenesis protein CcmH
MMRAVAAVLLGLLGTLSLAEEAPPAAADPVLEARVKTLSEELRCLVCQNQSLADSNAGLAVDLRNEVREMMRAGKSDAEIREFMVARYGDFVLYNPPMKTATLVLWVGPFVLLIAGGAVLAAYLRRRARRLPPQSITDEERARARDLLAGTSRKDS